VDPPSRALVNSARSGDASALPKLLDRHLPGLNSYIQLRIGPLLRTKETPEDLVQSVCREVLQKLDGFEFRTEAQFRHWLFQQAERKIIDRARMWQSERRDPRREVALAEGSSSGTEEPIGQDPTPSACASLREEVARLEKVMQQLPPDYREVILLSRIVGLSNVEVAERMKRSPGAVRVLLLRALARLTSLLPGGSKKPPL
jgi:RNA polymerase sigma-70 factor (ECF subfamily)